jgi:hypothetical protein
VKIRLAAAWKGDAGSEKGLHGMVSYDTFYLMAAEYANNIVSNDTVEVMIVGAR